jgi:hypothetical protein
VALTGDLIVLARRGIQQVGAAKTMVQITGEKLASVRPVLEIGAPPGKPQQPSD